MFRDIQDFLMQWDQESKATLNLLDQLTDESLKQKVTPDGRSLGHLAWHLVTTLSEMPCRAGLLEADALEKTAMPDTVKTLIGYYRAESARMTEAASGKWKNENLQEEIEMYGERWKKGMVLMSLILHQAHHRGQMTVLMRQAGLKVPGVYGPSREEWAQYGMSPQE